MSIDTHKGNNGASKKIYLGNTNIKKIYYRNNIVYKEDSEYEIDLMSVPWNYANYPTTLPNCRAFIQAGTGYIGMESTNGTANLGWYQGIYWTLNNKEIISYKAVVDIASVYAEVGNGFMIKNASQLALDNFNAYGYAIDFNVGYRQNVTLQANVNVSYSGNQYLCALLTGRGTEESMLIKSLKVTVRDL